jgi:hypothetical protein
MLSKAARYVVPLGLAVLGGTPADGKACNEFPARGHELEAS